LNISFINTDTTYNAVKSRSGAKGGTAGRLRQRISSKSLHSHIASATPLLLPETSPPNAGGHPDHATARPETEMTSRPGRRTGSRNAAVTIAATRGAGSTLQRRRRARDDDVTSVAMTTGVRVT